MNLIVSIFSGEDQLRKLSRFLQKTQKIAPTYSAGEQGATVLPPQRTALKAVLVLSVNRP